MAGFSALLERFLLGGRFILRVREASFLIEDPHTFNLTGITVIVAHQLGVTLARNRVYTRAVHREVHLPRGYRETYTTMVYRETYTTLGIPALYTPGYTSPVHTWVYPHGAHRVPARCTYGTSTVHIGGVSAHREASPHIGRRTHLQRGLPASFRREKKPLRRGLPASFGREGETSAKRPPSLLWEEREKPLRRVVPFLLKLLKTGPGPRSGPFLSRFIFPFHCWACSRCLFLLGLMPV